MDIYRDHWYLRPMRTAFAFLILLLSSSLVADQLYRPCNLVPQTTPVITHALSAALIESESGEILWSRQGDRPWVPASLTKLVATYTVLAAAEEGRLTLTTTRPVDPRAYASAVPPGSSLMFLGPDHNPSGYDLLAGLFVASGNDASVEIALRTSGSVAAFIDEMNRRVAEIGYEDFRFYDPAGLSADNRITAVGFARFSADLMRMYPEVVDLARLREFTWPPGDGITQQNRNGMLRTYAGTDGLKTGFIEESDYNIAVSARRDGLHLIAVVLGVEASSHAEGARRRERDAGALLDWGFAEWTREPVGAPDIRPIPVYGGRQRELTAVARIPESILLHRSQTENLRGQLELVERVRAPIERGEPLGFVRFTSGSCVVAEYSIVADVAVESGGFFRRIWDALRWWWISRST